MALNPKQDRFCTEYLKDLNATAAAARAGYSVKSSRQSGCDLLALPAVQERLNELKGQIAAAAEITTLSIVKGIAAIEQANIFDFIEVDEEGETIRIKDINSIPKEKQLLISELSITPGKYGPAVRVKLHDRQKAQDMLMKHLGGYITSSDLIDKLPPERLEQLVKELLAKLNHE